MRLEHEPHPVLKPERGDNVRWGLLTYVGQYRVSTVQLYRKLYRKHASDVLAKDMGTNAVQSIYGQEYETMVFDDGADTGPGSYDLDVQRYDTQAEAEVGHREMWQKWYPADNDSHEE